MRKQKNGPVLGTAQRFEMRLVREAWLGLPKHLKCRPQPRARFDEAARASNPTTPGWSLVVGAQDCLAAAAREGAATLHDTRTEVEHFFDALKEVALRGYVDEAPSLDLVLVTAAREASEALAADTAYAVERSPSALSALVRETREAIAAGKVVLHAASATLVAADRRARA